MPLGLLISQGLIPRSSAAQQTNDERSESRADTPQLCCGEFHTCGERCPIFRLPVSVSYSPYCTSDTTILYFAFLKQTRPQRWTFSEMYVHREKGLETGERRLYIQNRYSREYHGAAGSDGWDGRGIEAGELCVYGSGKISDEMWSPGIAPDGGPLIPD